MNQSWKKTLSEKMNSNGLFNAHLEPYTFLLRCCDSHISIVKYLVVESTIRAEPLIDPLSALRTP
jgi:hypothetical protein